METKFKCQECGYAGEAEDFTDEPYGECPDCGSADIDLAGGIR